LSLIYPLTALFTSVFLLLAGNALVSIVTPVRASLDGFGDLTVGLLGSAYFFGMLAGALKAPAIVGRVGHIRAFAACVALAVVSIDALPAVEAPWAWMLSRALLGFVFAGVYAVIESWINGFASNNNRGALYAIYQIVNYSASSFGQLLMGGLGVMTFLPFTVASALTALAIVPLSMTKSDAPEMPRAVRIDFGMIGRLAPVSLAGSFVAGWCNGSSTSLAPLYALQIGVSPRAVPLFTTAIVIGSALGVYPVGRLSDRMDRRLIMAVAMAIGAALEFALASFNPSGLSLISLGFFVGLTTFTLYTLTISLANDGIDAQDMVVVSAGLLFIYCAAAVAAPAVAPAAMRAFGPGALYWLNGIGHAALALFATWSLVGAPAALSPRRR
jgi:MFS family permease